MCRIPDFRRISHAEHTGLLEAIFGHLHENGRVPDDWLARQIKRIDRTDGDIDALSKRLAFIRTWTYVAQRKGWVGDESHWRGETRAVEDRISDALHTRLTQRFVDRRTSVLLRRLNQKEALLTEVNENGDVTVEGEFVGRLEGFRFMPDKAAAAGAEAKTLKTASLQALVPHFHLRADRFYNAPDTEIDFTEQCGLMWGEHAVGKLVAGAEALKPQVEVFVDEAAGADVVQKVQRRLQHFTDRKVAALFEPLLALQRDETLTGQARGFAFRIVEALGILPRADIAQEVKDLDQEARGALRKHGIRFGQFTVFLPLLLKPAPTRLRLVLWSLTKGLQEFPEAPPPGLVTVPVQIGAAPGHDAMASYRIAGERMIRIDMLERLADMLRAEDSHGGFEAKADMLSITGMTLEQFADLMQGLGYHGVKGEREKVKAAPKVAPETAEAAAPDTPETDAGPTEPDAQPTEAEAEPKPEPEAAAPAETPTAPEQDAAAPETPVEDGATDDASAEAEKAPADAEPEKEVFYTFTWGRQRPAHQGNRGQRSGGKPQGKGKPRGKPQGKRGRDGDKGGKRFTAKPPRKEKPIDPDNPFAAALMGLKEQK